jgi:uridine kinase
VEERASTNFDHPDSLDTALLVQNIKDLKKGLSVEVPTYDFTTHTRTKTTEERTPRKIILVEGILLFSDPQLVEELDMKVFVVRVFGLDILCSFRESASNLLCSC